MRVISGLVAASMLVASAQPALAVCVIRGGVTNCVRDSKLKYPHVSHELETNTPAENPNRETVVLQPNTASGNAWVLTPETTVGARVLGSGGTLASACGSSAGC